MLILAAALAAAGARAGTDPGAAGRRLDVPADPDFEPALRELEQRMPAYEAALETALRVPAQTIDLGMSSKIYHCWRLRLTGDHGRQARGVLESMRSVQSAMQELMGRLTQELASYAASPKPDPEARRRILAVRESLDLLLNRYDTLLGLGKRNGFIESSEGSLLQQRRTVSPRLNKDDYSMVRDETLPGCGAPAEDGNPREPSGV